MMYTYSTILRMLFVSKAQTVIRVTARSASRLCSRAPPRRRRPAPAHGPRAPAPLSLRGRRADARARGGARDWGAICIPMPLPNGARVRADQRRRHQVLQTLLGMGMGMNITAQ